MDNNDNHNADDANVKGRGLGRGLAALFGDDEDMTAIDFAETGGDEAFGEDMAYRMMPVEWLKPCPFQPRRHFDKDALKELAESIAAHGIIQPLLVRPLPDEDNSYEIIAGERRWRAAQLAQVHEVPVTIQYLTDAAVLELALIENLQREDLSAIEEAEAYQRLMNEYGHTQEKLAATLGKSRSHIANTLRLLSLPDSVKAMVGKGELSAGHARTLVGADNPEALAQEIIDGGLSVRDAEKMKAGARSPSAGKSVVPLAPKQAKGVDVSALEEELSNLLGLRVEIAPDGKGGRLSIHYATLDQLDDILHRLSHNPGRIVLNG